MKYSIIIPAHNEAERLGDSSERLKVGLDLLGRDDCEVILIDDGSSDGTGVVAAQILRDLPHSMVIRRESNHGKGAAIRLGIAAASGDHVFTCDADMAIHPRQLPALNTALEHCDLAAGSRSLTGSIHYNSVLRSVAGWAFNAYVRARIPTTLRDTQCGCKAFRLPAARVLALYGLIDGFAFDAEMLYVAHEIGLVVEPVGVTWDDVAGSTVRVGRDSLRMMRDIAGVARTPRECPVIRVEGLVTAEAVGAAARAARIQGLVIASSPNNSWILVSRDSALGALEIASALHGQMGVARPSELRGRTLVAV